MLIGFVPNFSYADDKDIRENVKIESEKKFIKSLKEKKEKTQKKYEDKNGNEIVRIIVQTKDNPEISGGKPDYENLKEEISKFGDNIEFKRDFSYLISGFSLDIPQKYVSKVSALKGVKSVSYARTFKPMMADAVKITEATKIWEERDYKGEGMVISIIDSGIDVNHKDMRLSNPSKAKIQNIKDSSDTKFTMKVPYGYNYADGTDIVKDNNSVGKSMHGMHVAGIVAGNASDEDYKNGKGIRGIAPEAQLLAMKVFSNNQGVDTAYEDAIVQAIEDSVKQGADVINMSLGVDNGFGSDTDPEIIAIKEARERGVICVVSAGNEAMSTTKSAKSRIPTNDLNLRDNAAIGAPSAGEHSFSVASSNNSSPSGFFGTVVGGENTDFTFEIGTNKDLINKEKNYEVVDAGLGTEDDFLKDGNPMDLTGKAVLILRGDISFKDKLENAQKHKAEIVIIANDKEEPFRMAGVEDIKIPSIVVTKKVGELLKEKVKNNSKIKFDLRPDFTGSNEVSSFTAYGPTPELEFKPEVMAPGGHIISTVNDNKYEEMSGTSMAAPHLSGAIALMLGELKDENFAINKIDFVRLSLTNTANPLDDTAAGTGLKVSPRRQGAGLINVDKALKNRVLITDENGRAVKSLKEISGVINFDLTLSNYSDREKTYAIEFTDVLTEFTDTSNFQVKDIKMDGAKISADKKSITIAGNSKANVKITLDVTNAPKNQFAEGYIYFKAENQPTLVFPYLAFNGDWNSEAIFDKPKSQDGSIYDVLGLVSGGNYLGSTFDYMTFTEKVDPNKVAFSPNGDDNLDTVVLVLGLIRSAKVLDVDVVEEMKDDAKSLVHITTTNDIRRPHYAYKNAVPFGNGIWDGQIFNQKTGKYETIPDGQYYIRATAKVTSKDDLKQTIYLPLKVDTTKPKLEILENGFVGDEYIIKFKAKDEGIGLADEGVGAYVDNEDKESLVENSGIYEYKVPKAKLQDGKEHTITVGAIDEVFNVKTEVIKLSENAVVFYNATDKVIGSKNRYISEDLNNYKLLGHIGKNISKLIVNDIEANIDDETFEVIIPIKDGENLVKFEAFNKAGEKVASSSDENKIILKKDVIAPELNITSPDIEKVVKLDSKKLNVVGTVKDNSGGEIRLSVGSGLGKKLNSGDGFDESTNVDWTRIVRVRAVDSAGNETVKEIRTVFEDDDEEFKIYFKDLSTFEFMNGKSYQVKDDKLEMVGHVNKKVKSLIIDGVEVEIGEDLRFTHLQPLKEVNNHIGVKVIGLDDSVLFEGGYTIYYDKTLPNLSLDLEVSDDNIIYTNKNPFAINGSASDNGHGYRLYINGDEVLNYDETGNTGEKMNLRKFSKEVDSTTGNTTFIEISDSFGNKFSRKYSFVFDDVAPEVELEGIENGEIKLPSKLKFNANEDAKLEISVNGNEYNGEILEEAGSYVVKVRATDKAGNITLKTFKFEGYIEIPDNSNEEELIKFESEDGKITVETKSIKDKNLKLNYYNLKDLKNLGLDEKSELEAFDICFTDSENNKVDVPEGEYIVTIKKDKKYINEKVEKVFYIDDNNKMEYFDFEDMEKEVRFKTKHFSKYGIQYKYTKKPMANDDNNGNITKKPNGKTLVKTGHGIGNIMIVSVISILGMTALLIKKKKEV